MILFLPKDSLPCKLYIKYKYDKYPFTVEWENKIYSYTKEKAAGIKSKIYQRISYYKIML